MGYPRVYKGKTGFNFFCPACEQGWIMAAARRLAANPTFECYQCGKAFTVQNAPALVEAFDQARVAIHRLREAIDDSDMVMSADFYGATEVPSLKVADLDN